MYKKAVLFFALCAAPVLLAEDKEPPKQEKPADKEKAKAEYPLKTCVVSGEDLGDKPVDFDYKGRTIKLCCKGCIKKFNAEPDKYIKILDEAEKKAAEKK
jgi:hypothetical protein